MSKWQRQKKRRINRQLFLLERRKQLMRALKCAQGAAFVAMAYAQVQAIRSSSQLPREERALGVAETVVHTVDALNAMLSEPL